MLAPSNQPFAVLPPFPAAVDQEQSGVVLTDPSHAHCGAFLVVDLLLGCVLACSEVGIHHWEALGREPADVVYVTCWATLDMVVSLDART